MNEQSWDYVRRLQLVFGTTDFEMTCPDEMLSTDEHLNCLRALDVVNHAIPPNFRLTWDELHRTMDEYRGPRFTYPHRLPVIMHLLLRQLPRLNSMCSNSKVNIAQLYMHCNTIKSVTVMACPLRPCEIATLLRINSLQTLDINVISRGPTESTDALPTGQSQVQELQVVYQAEMIEEGSSEPHIVKSLLRKLANIRKLQLIVQGREDQLFEVMDSASKNVRHLTVVSGAEVNVKYDSDALHFFKQLEVLTIQPRLLLGCEPCKHKKDEEISTYHPSHLINAMVPNSLERIVLLVDRDHVLVNGDDFYVHLMRALINEPSCLPTLRRLTIDSGPEYHVCMDCESWYGTENGIGEPELCAYITQHEYDRMCRLSKLRGVDFRCLVDRLVNVPVDSRGRGLNMRRIQKINVRRTWYDPERDEDMGLFELFNT